MEKNMSKLGNVPHRYARYAEIMFYEDASGWQTFKCGKLGELTENIRTFALPFESQPYTFRMNFEYDSWNRIQQMTYPDGEVVSYGYNLGGMLDSIGGQKGSFSHPYIKHIAYNQYELKDSVLYGNGTLATYGYDVLMRLKMLQSYTGTSPAELMQDIYYDYDAVSNITYINNQATMLSCGLGGKYESSYTYDNLYRLSSAGGNWDNGTMTNTYVLSMGYHPNGRIAKKLLQADILDHLGNVTTKNYDNLYSYPIGKNTLEQTLDRNNLQIQTFGWDQAGNMTKHRLQTECTRWLCWDEENRLQGVADCNYASLYQYDANGERTYKLTGRYQYQNINGRYFPYAVLDNPTLYASPYVVCTPKGYTKHYYAESERVASKIGNGCLQDLCKSINAYADFNRKNLLANSYLLDCNSENDTLKKKQERLSVHFRKVMDCTSASSIPEESKLGILNKLIDCINEKEKDCYWYHPDHLGSSSWITDVNGKPVQHLHYLPWGEDFVDQRSTNWNAIHAFSSKERDVETGLSYFWARYYSSDLSIWLSVDPMVDKYPSLSPYVYCANNPVKLVDPNGETVVIPNEDDQAFIENLVNPDSKEYSKEFHDIYKKLQQSSTTYTFESWSYDASRREDGLFDRGNENNNPSIHFTKDDNPQIQDRAIGASRYRVLFEETYHAYQYEKRGKVVNSCISEAAAWKFSTLAPGTKMTYFDDKSGEWTTTLMGRIHDSSIPSIALGFKFGMPATSTATGIQGPGLYSDFKLGSAQELKVFFPYFNF